MKRMTIHACAMLAVALVATKASGGASPAAKCQSSKLKLTANYSSCRLKAQSKAVKKSETPAELAAALAKCDAKFIQKWTTAEQRGGAACPTTGDASPLQSITIDFSHFATLALDSVRFIDNGDGTITDTRTRLMWEKKGSLDTEVDLSDPHDVDNLYFWSANSSPPQIGSIFTDFLERLNNCTSDGASIVGGFAGYCDWRLPNIFELIGILDLSRGQCAGGSGPCIDPAFGPTRPEVMWSGTTDAGDATKAWYNRFGVAVPPLGTFQQGTFAKEIFPLGARAVRTLP